MGHQHQHSCADHEHVSFLGKHGEIYFSISAGVFLILGFVIQKLTDLNPAYYLSAYVMSYIFGGFYAVLEAYEKIRKLTFEIDFLMIAAAVGAAYIGSWAEGALLLFLFSLGHALEHHALNKAQNAIESLGHLSPKTALLKTENGLKEIAIEDLEIGDVIVVQPHTKIAADGVIVLGSSSVDQASITGESMPVDKTAISKNDRINEFADIPKQHVVYSGTINGDQSIEVRVLRYSADSTVARLVKMVSEVETHKSPTQRLTKKFEIWYVPIVVLTFILLCFAHLVIDESFNESLYRAITVLVAASPCALAISTPSAVLSAVARAAQKGVLIKGGKALEDLGIIETIAFDKTGTLTEGTPKLTDIVACNNFDKTELLRIVLEVESSSNHPLARAISKDICSQYEMRSLDQASNVTALQGMGVSASFKDKDVYIGNLRLMDRHNVEVSAAVRDAMESLLKEGYTVMLVAFDQLLIGYIVVIDMPRATAVDTLKRLKAIGIKNMVMLTGDHQNVGDTIGRKIGLTEVKGNLMPEDKVTAVQSLLQRDGRIAMVGDGVNDAPAMAISTVSVAMGAAGSDVALETADIALMSDKIEMLPFVISLSRASKRIIKQNIFISLAVVAILVPISIMGWTNIGMAVIFHEGSTVVVVLNALRLLRYSKELNS